MQTFNFRSEQFVRWRIKPLLWVLALLPFAALVWGVMHESLGADPQKYIVHKTGAWTLRFLFITLAITPARKWFAWPTLLLVRRLLGLFAFFYATLHLSAYYGLYLSFDLNNVLEDLLKRPYIVVGFSAFLLLVPLALTSTRAAMRKLGKRWQKLHRCVYVIAVLGVVHFFWLVKSDLNEPLFYALLLSSLLGVRVYWFLSNRRANRVI